MRIQQTESVPRIPRARKSKSRAERRVGLVAIERDVCRWRNKRKTVVFRKPWRGSAREARDLTPVIGKGDRLGANSRVWWSIAFKNAVSACFCFVFVTECRMLASLLRYLILWFMTLLPFFFSFHFSIMCIIGWDLRIYLPDRCVMCVQLFIELFVYLLICLYVIDDFVFYFFFKD